MEAKRFSIDGRLQEVLGHFRKQFQGEVSAENLGAKFGEYGSFLPTTEAAVTSKRLNKPITEAVGDKKEDWVCCDKCQKWRLLPLSINPDDLPEMWFCSMLNWLPGMNRCSYSEEETTQALRKKGYTSSCHVQSSTKKRKTLEKSSDGKEKKPKIFTSSSVKIISNASLVESVSSTSLLTEAALGVDKLKGLKSTKELKKQSENQPRISFSSKDANSVIIEARNLKHLADRLRNSGSNVESKYLYFEAALKFLHGAFLLESGIRDTAMEVYKSTAELCEFCALEYEKYKDFAASALAYKMIEVAYMRVIHSSNTDAKKDRQELEKTLQESPLGESSSSVASDSNNAIIVDKDSLAKGKNAATDCSNLARLINFAENVNKAMEASRRCRGAFEAATTGAKESGRRESINLVKNAINFNFHDLERLIGLLRLAMDVMSH